MSDPDTSAETFDIPDVLPLLPVRDAVVFPTQVVPLFVSREMSLAAVEHALAHERMIFAVAQRDPAEDAPQAPEGMHALGTCCLVLRQRKLPDGRIKVLVQGLVKGTLESVEETEPCTRVRVRKIHELPFAGQGDAALEAEALGRSVKAQLDKLIATGHGISPEQLLLASGVNDPGRLADLCASSLSLKQSEAQEILELLDPVERLQRIHDRLAREAALSAMQARLQVKAKEEISKVQRDYYLREQLRQIQHELGERDEKSELLEELRRKIDGARLPQHAADEAQKELRRLSAMSLDAAEGAVLRSHLEWICELPWNAQTEDEIDLLRARKILDDEHHGLARVKERILETLAVRKLHPRGRSPVLLFTGPPGVGKTSLARSIARAMGRKLARISLGGVRDEAEIRGHRRTYVGALPGRILQALKQAGSKNPVFVLDELDKLGDDVRAGDPASALLEVLDPEQNHAFRDHYLNLDFDLSAVFFIATANSDSQIPPALRDRMEVIELPGYSEEEKLAIGERYLLPKQLSQHGLAEGQLSLQPEAWVRLVRDYTREAGVRELGRELSALCRKTALRIAEERPHPGLLGAAQMPELLGIPRFDALATDLDEAIGVATGLAWTPWGGEVLRVEATAMRSQRTRGLILTGQLGPVMQESAQAALSYVRSRASLWGVPANFFDLHDLHLHVPAGAIPKDGPSAGSTIAVALASLICGRPCKRAVAMTGEATLRGRILAVGGVREKLLAAARAGVTTVCIPEGNLRELADLGAESRALAVIPVSTLDDLFTHVLVGGPPSPRAAVAAAKVS